MPSGPQHFNIANGGVEGSAPACLSEVAVEAGHFSDSVHDGPGNVFLAPHGVDGDDAALEGEAFEELFSTEYKRTATLFRRIVVTPRRNGASPIRKKRISGNAHFGLRTERERAIHSGWAGN